MRILVSCDSTTGEASWAGLSRAGLPGTGEFLVLSVADVILPDSEEYADAQSPRPYLPPGVRRSHARAALLLENALRCSRGVGYKLQEKFPGWQVSTKAVAESPIWGVVCAAASWKADLIVLDVRKSKPHFLLLDDALKVIHEAPRSTHLVRHKGDTIGDSPLNLLAVLEGHSAADIVQALAEREWPRGSVVRLVAAPGLPTMSGAAVPREVVEKLTNMALEVSSLEVKGDLKRAAVEEARLASTDLIFVGAGARKRFWRPKDSLPLYVAAHAHCSVEVVRPPRLS